MINQLAGHISRYLTFQGFCSEDDEELVTYGLSSILSDILQVLVLLIVAIPLGVLFEMAAFAVFYGLLRPNIGGAHANSHLQCLVIFTSVAIVAVVAAIHIPLAVIPILAPALTLVGLIIVFIRAPIAHPNVPKSQASLRKIRKKARIIVVLEFICITVCSVVLPGNLLSLAVCANFGVTVAVATLLIPIKNERGENHE